MSPLTFPPTEYVLVMQLTASATGPAATVPDGAVTEQVCHATGGPQRYTGRSMRDSHAHLAITEGEWRAFLDDLAQTFDRFRVPAAERAEVVAIVESTKGEIVAAGGPA